MIDIRAVKGSILEHAELIYPNECCGALLGDTNGEIKIVREILPIGNAREAGEQYHRFVIESGDVMRAERTAARKGLDVLGFYHSHPDHFAEPSDYDREHALPNWSYPIVSVQKGKAAEIRSWLLSDTRESYIEEVIL